MGKRTIDIFNNPQLSILADICDYTYLLPVDHIPESLIYLKHVIKEKNDNGEFVYTKNFHYYTVMTFEIKPDCLVIAFRGTNDILSKIRTDLKTDIKLVFLNKLTAWLEEDGHLLERIMTIIASFPDHKIIFTGHSLGGALAKWCALSFDKEAVAFNSFSIMKLPKKDFSNKNDYSLISNVRVKQDIVSQNVHDENWLGADFRECCHIKVNLIPFKKALEAHSIKNFRLALAAKATRDLQNYSMSREKYWALFSQQTVSATDPLLQRIEEYRNKRQENPITYNHNKDHNHRNKHRHRFLSNNDFNAELSDFVGEPEQLNTDETKKPSL